MSKAKIVELNESNTCKLCDNALAKYSCPKCSIKYCSLSCYQSEQHLQCSEDFYKKCIEEELAQQDNEDSKRKMLEILKRNHLENNESGSDSELDSDDEDVEDIAERLAGVDLDDADQVWEKLTHDEQQAFIAFLKSEDVSKLISSWEPWWGYHEKNLELLEEVEKFKETCPKVMQIRDFKEISKKDPADCVKFNLINVIAAYAFTVRYFNGEHHDFSKEVVTCMIAISLTLRNNQNFKDYETAVKSVEFQCTESDWIVADSENFKLLREDLDKILKGPNSSEKNYYVLCALSELHNILDAALKKTSKKTSFNKTFPNDHFPEVKLVSKNKTKNCIKKIEYLLSFAKDFC